MKILYMSVLTLHFILMNGMIGSREELFIKQEAPTLKKVDVYGRVLSDEAVELSYTAFWKYLQAVPSDVLDYLIDMASITQRVISEEEHAGLTCFFSNSHPKLDSSLYEHGKSDKGAEVIKYTCGIRRPSFITHQGDGSPDVIFNYPPEASLSKNRAYRIDVRFEDKTFMLQNDKGLLFCKWIRKAKDEPTTIVLKRHASPEFASPKIKALFRSRRGACFGVDDECLRILKTPRTWHTDWQAKGVVENIGDCSFPVLAKFPSCIMTEWQLKPYHLYIYLKDERDKYRLRLDIEWPFQLKQFKNAAPYLKRYVVLRLAFINNQVPLAQENAIKRKLFTLDHEKKMEDLLPSFIRAFIELKTNPLEAPKRLAKRAK